MKKVTVWLLMGILAISLMGCEKAVQSSEGAAHSDVIYEETISPNEKYTDNREDWVYYTITVYRTDNGVEVASSSNAAFSKDMDYEVQTAEAVSKEDIQVQWQTLSGSTSDTEDDKFAVAVVTVSSGGKVISQQTVSFIGGAIDRAMDAIGAE